MRFETAIEHLVDNYRYAKSKVWIRDKVAWALYHTWKEADDRKTENCSEIPNNSDTISRQAAISAICNACGKIDCDKMDKCEKLQLPPANCSEFPNNCEHITEDGVTCAKYPACDDCLDNPLNKVKGSERLVKGSEKTDCLDRYDRKTEPTSSKMEQVEDELQTEKGGCTNCDGKDLCNNAFTEISQYCGAYEPQNGYQTFNGTSVYVSRLEDEPQTEGVSR